MLKCPMKACHLSIRRFSHGGQQDVRAAFDWRGNRMPSASGRFLSDAACGKTSTTRRTGQTVRHVRNGPYSGTADVPRRTQTDFSHGDENWVARLEVGFG